MTAIEPLQASALDRAVVTAAGAFLPDPMITWVFPDAARRPAQTQTALASCDDVTLP